MSGDVLDTPAAGGLVIRGSALRIGAYVASTLLSVASAAVVIAHLGAADYGRYVTVFSLVTLVAAVTDAGMTTLGVRSYTTEEAGRRGAILATLLGLRLALTSAGVLVALGFALLAGYDDAMVLGAILASVGLALTVAQTTLTVPLQSELLMGRVSALELLRQVATTVLLVALAIAGAGIVGLLAVTIPVGILLLVATALLVRGRAPLLPRIDLAEWWALLRLTASFALATAMGTLYIYAAILVMSLVSTEAETGNFGAAFRVFIVLAAVPGVLVTTAFPVLARAARDDRERLAYALGRLFDTSVIGGLAFALVTAFGAPVAIDIITAGEEGFGPAVDALRIIAAAMLASFVLATWGFGLISLHRHRALLVANALAMSVSVALTLVLAGEYGASGAATATVAGEAVLALAYLVALSRERGMRPRARSAVRALAAAVPAAGLGLALHLPAAVEAAMVGGVYVVLVLVLRALPPELRDLLPRPLR